MNGIMGSVDDILPIENGFVIIAHIQETNDTGIVKFNYALESLWQYQTPVHSNASIATTSEGGVLFNWWYSPRMRLMKISAEGDSLWTIEYIPGVYKESILESNGNYYGLRHSDNVVNGLLKVYDYGADFSIVNPDTPILTIPTYRLLDEDKVFPAIRTSDNNIVIAVSTPTGEIFKFDSNFNMLWSSNALPIERIGVGKHPLLELDNGDILYCARVMYGASTLTERIAIVRIDSNGNYVGIVDEYEATPPVSCVSAYPNPFSREITLSIKRRALPTSKFIIYNIKGQQIASIDINDNPVTWIPKDVPSGLYIVKLVEGSKTIESHLISYIK
jgi:hypothetical protein